MKTSVSFTDPPVRQICKETQSTTRNCSRRGKGKRTGRTSTYDFLGERSFFHERRRRIGTLQVRLFQRLLPPRFHHLFLLSRVWEQSRGTGPWSPLSFPRIEGNGVSGIVSKPRKGHNFSQPSPSKMFIVSKSLGRFLK